ncbi:MAG TPA: hypothetical protein VHX44_08745, partial [Planctomycetota bacterium]|nr:hypothetical protein [Planctomycetota bacterium]
MRTCGASPTLWQSVDPVLCHGHEAIFSHGRRRVVGNLPGIHRIFVTFRSLTSHQTPGISTVTREQFPMKITPCHFLLMIAAVAIAVPLRGGETMTVQTLFSVPINPANGVHPLWTPVQHDRGKTFVVVPDVG